MMLGVVNSNREATIRIVIGNQNNQKKIIDGVIDTGFTGFLSLPLAIITEFNLPWSYRDRGTLGDGSETIFDIYIGMVIWDGQLRTIEINAADTEPLVGMSLLYGYDLRIQAIEGGTVTIAPLS
jgi:clan AA aspartic protease